MNWLISYSSLHQFKLKQNLADKIWVTECDRYLVILLSVYNVSTIQTVACDYANSEPIHRLF